jgi:hypothetical protein
LEFVLLPQYRGKGTIGIEGIRQNNDDGFYEKKLIIQQISSEMELPIALGKQFQ